ncbi:ThiF family adenylyltransferase [Devosia salina]|uniref:ThiF family adenylyltransferase n=1 Tax=Devosia salina TaxID=2860336 RepID=A0ABX8WH42_9HYPH|nr:ThiF family adenylyltransferase [Devosia salina]QYO75605.1 ThiF family adenylyltransferase [Devosia salina]
MQPWIASFPVVECSTLGNSLAAAFVDHVRDGGDGIFELVEARRDRSMELILANVRTERPQRSVVTIDRVEPIAIVFGDGKHGPCVLALREDFPDTPHQARLPKGMPFCICIDDRPWSEAKSSYGPAELGHRILQWFRKAARGQLHDAAQPLEPFFSLQSPYELIMPREAWGNDADKVAELIGIVQDQQRPTMVTLLPAKERQSANPVISVIAYDLSAETMSRMRQAPATLADLAEETLRRGLDIVADLKARLKIWYADETRRAALLNSYPCILLRLPMINPITGHMEGLDTVGFMVEGTVGDIGVALGLFYSDRSSDLNSIGYQLRFPAGDPDLDALRLEGCLIHGAFDTQLARAISGVASPVLGKAVMIGAGAIGSAVAEILVREGAFDSMSVMDDDTLLPHNVSRHTLTSQEVPRPKATSVGQRLKFIRPDLDVSAIDANFLAEPSPEAQALLHAADIIVDASASVAVGRALSDLAGHARRVSIFFNPTGTAVVLLAEDQDRRIDLRALEAVYHRVIQTEPMLENHLVDSEMIRYTGACRMLTSRIPASRVQVLSGLVAGGLSRALGSCEACVKIWSLGEEGVVSLVTPQVDLAIEHAGDWTIRMPDTLSAQLAEERLKRLPNETGGALLGIVDPQSKRIELVAAVPAPIDSTEAPTEFVRGTMGLRETVEAAIARSAGQIRYVGEWHSHPRGSSSQPSTIDIEQLTWLSTTMAGDGMPGVMVIVGENEARHLVGTFR